MGRESKRDKEARKKAKQKSMVYISIPDAFLDVTEEPWTLKRDGRVEELDLGEVIEHTLRACPVKTGDDADRVLDIFTVVREADGHIAMSKVDWDWMLAHFNDMAHTVWNPPDSAFLRRYLEKNVSNKVSEPRPDPEPDPS